MLTCASSRDSCSPTIAKRSTGCSRFVAPPKSPTRISCIESVGERCEAIDIEDQPDLGSIRVAGVDFDAQPSNVNGIDIVYSDHNTVANNTFVGNTEHDILGEYMTEEDETEEDETEGSGPEVLLFIGFAGIIMLGAGWRMVNLSRGVLKWE